MPSLSDKLTDRQLIQVGDLTRCFRARDTALDRFVFVKFLNPSLAANAEIKVRFEREAKSVARLDHPNLVRIYESGEDPDEGFYMVFEWVDGKTLREGLTAGKRYTGEDFIALAKQLLAGLAALHGEGILHRDLKPENILIRPDDCCKITDFSLAAITDTPMHADKQSIVGTPPYMSPEVISGGEQSEGSDLFSVGVILYEAVTGTNPFLEEDIVGTFRNIRELPLTIDESACPGLSKQSLYLLRRLLDKDPLLRPRSANAALDLLRENAKMTSPATTSYKSKSRYISLAVVVITVWIILMNQMGKHETKPERQDTPRKASEVASNPEFRSRSATPGDSAEPDPATETHVSKIELQRNPGQSSGEKTQDRLTPNNAKDPRTVPGSVASGQPAVTLHLPDSVDFYLTTDPWVHVYLQGEQLGTTPLESPLRVPSGEQNFVLRNPAFPPVDFRMTLSGDGVHKHVNLVDYVALIKVKVKPWGELYLDGEHIGQTPLPKPLYLSPGRHSLRISHPELTAVSKEITVTAGETLSVDADLTQNQITVQAQ